MGVQQANIIQDTRREWDIHDGGSIDDLSDRLNVTGSKVLKASELPHHERRQSVRGVLLEGLDVGRLKRGRVLIPR